MDKGGLEQSVSDVVRDLELLVGRNICLMRGVVAEAAASMQALLLVLAELALRRQFLHARLQSPGGGAIV